MGDKTADPSIETMAPELYRAEDSLEATYPLPAASTAGMSVTETLLPKEPPKIAPTTDKPMAVKSIVNSDSRPAAEALATTTTTRRETVLPESFLPQDCTMAMENNPVTRAGAHYNVTDQETLKPSTTPESSAIGCMVPTPAATPSRISFDGSYQNPSFEHAETQDSTILISVARIARYIS